MLLRLTDHEAAALLLHLTEYIDERECNEWPVAAELYLVVRELRRALTQPKKPWDFPVKKFRD